MITFREIDTHPDKRSIRKFATILLFGLPISGLVVSSLSYLIQGSLSLTPFYVFCGIAILAFALSFISKKAGRAIHIAWHSVSASIEWCLSLVSLSLMYYAVLLPVALLMKCLRRRSPLTSLDRDQPSYWVDNARERNLSSYFRQY
jgi:hypothetical protein